MQTQAQSVLPKRQQEALDDFCDKLKSALGDKLSSIVLFGGAARGDYYPKSSDVNLTIVLTATDKDTLLKMRQPLLDTQLALKLGFMVVTERDIERSTDVFPSKFFLMQRHHKILHGKDVVAGIEVNNRDLRLRCEQELKNILMRLRASFIRAARPERVEKILAAVITTVLANLRVLGYLAHQVEPGNDQETLKMAAEKFKLDSEVLSKCLALKRRELEPSGDELAELFQQLSEQVEKASLLADDLEVS